MRFIRFPAFLLGSFASAGLLTACSGAPVASEPGPAREPRATSAEVSGSQGPNAPAKAEQAPLTEWKVVPKPTATILQGSDAAAVIEATPQRVVFERAKLSDDKPLSVGRTLLVEGRALGRIEKVATEGDKLVLSLGPATLADVIEEGTFAWDAPLPLRARYAQPVSKQALRQARPPVVVSRSLLGMPQEPEPLPQAKRTATFTADPPTWTIGVDDYSYQIRAEPKGDDTQITFVLSKKSGNRASLAMRAEGLVKNSRSKGRATYAGGKLTEFQYEQPDLAADFQVSLQAAGAGIDEFKWSFPGSMFSFPVAIGPLPLTVSIGADVTAKIQVPLEASATAKSRFVFTAGSGFQWKGNDVEVTGKVGTATFDPRPADSAGPFGVGVDAQFGFGYPKVEISLFGQGLVPFFRPGVVVGTNLSWGPVCKSAYVKYVVDTGVDLTILGEKLKSWEKNLTTQEKRAQSDGCPP